MQIGPVMGQIDSRVLQIGQGRLTHAHGRMQTAPAPKSDARAQELAGAITWPDGWGGIKLSRRMQADRSNEVETGQPCRPHALPSYHEFPARLRVADDTRTELLPFRQFNPPFKAAEST